MAEFITYRGNTRRVFALNPDDIVYPKKITMATDFIFVGWKKWIKDSFREHNKVEFLPIELGRLMRYNIITREEHNTIINMLRSEDIESVYLAHRTIDGFKHVRHGRL